MAQLDAVLQTQVGGLKTVAIPATTATATVINDAPGKLCRVLITTLGASPVTFYDNASAASGLVIGYIAASAAVGSVIDFSIPAANGITADGAATLPGMTVSYL